MGMKLGCPAHCGIPFPFLQPHNAPFPVPALCTLTHTHSLTSPTLAAYLSKTKWPAASDN